MRLPRVLFICALTLPALAGILSCSAHKHAPWAPAPMAPDGPTLAQPGLVRTTPGDDLTNPGAVARGTTKAQVIDTRVFVPQVQLPEEGDVGMRLVKTILPNHV